LYTSVGTTTCIGDPGSYGFYDVDAKTFASWGIDYVKMDWCGSKTSPEGHQEFSDALNKTGTPIVLELCRGTYQSESKWGYAPKVAQLWRADGDHHDNFASVLSEVKSVEGRSSWSGPYGWAYLDMLMTGGQGCKGQSPDEAKHCPGMNDNEYRTEFSLYAITASPLLIGTDIRNMTAIMKELILNPEVLAVNQDYQVPPGDTQTICGGKYKVYSRKLSNGNIAVATPNLGTAAANIEICFSDFGGTKFAVRDLWKQTDLGTFNNNFTRSVAAHDTSFVILSKAN